MAGTTYFLENGQEVPINTTAMSHKPKEVYNPFAADSEDSDGPADHLIAKEMEDFISQDDSSS